MMRLKHLLFFLFLVPVFSFAQELEEQNIYVFQWGNLTDTIQNGEYNHSVMINTDLEHLKKMIDQPIFLLKNEEKIKIEEFKITVYNYGKPELTKMFAVENYNTRKPTKFHGNERIGYLLTSRSQLHLVNIKAKDGFNFFVNISLSTSIPSYVPAKLPSVPKGEVFEFQVVSFEDQKTILRVDTTNKEIQHITKIYANPEKYKIIHIPNFQTTRRLISEVDFIEIDKKPQVLIEDKSLVKLSFTEIPEFTEYAKDDKPILLEWGEMKNVDYEEIETLEGIDILTSDNLFQPSDVLDALGNPLILSLGYQDFEIIKMRVSIVPESGIPTSFVTDHLNYPEIEKALAEIPNRSVILFDEIFIENKSDQTIFLPPAFQFIIGANQ